MSRRTGRTLIFAFVGLALVAGALIPRLLSSSRRNAAPTRSAAQTLRVGTVTITPQMLVERLATAGTVRANEEVELVSEIAGKVAEVHFREGSRVATGALLVKIDDTQLSAERDRAAFRVDLAEQREARQRRLFEEGLVSQDDYDTALSELNVLRAELELSEARLIKTEIRAPFGGVIGLRNVSPGSYLTSQTLIATLQDVDPVKIDFSVPEKYVGDVVVGGQIEFKTKGSWKQHSGTIIAIEPRVDLDTRSLTLRARSPNHNGELVPGAFADVEITVRQIDDALAVPSRAVIPELGGKKVFVYEDGQAQPRAVETGLRTEDLVQVTRGLEANDRVIVTAIQRLRPGLPVEPQEERP